MTTSYEQQLNSFDRGERDAALRAAMAAGAGITPDTDNHNMHFHSFFSYNAEGWSPSRIAWEARKAGLHAAGLCDFDVLDGVEEFLDAGLVLGLRTAASLETRAYFREYADHDISSPGEPGVTYIMGAGFVDGLTPGTPPAETLAQYRAGARDRNVALINRINPHLPDIAIDYETDVLPLTPAGGATERHIITAYLNKASAVFDTPARLAEFWGPVLGCDSEATVALLADLPKMEESARAKLVKSGGIGYEQPSEDTFPPVDDFIAWVLSANAIPMVTWLDGTSGGEADGRAMLECMQAKGAAALNIVPDRNWNISDPDTRAVKVANLNAIVEAANALDLPVNIGTEMNKLGLPFVDDLAVDALRPHAGTFVRGARIMVGQAVLARYAGFSYVSATAAQAYPAVGARNDFFAKVGGLPPLTEARAAELRDMGPEKALAALHDACG